MSRSGGSRRAKPRRWRPVLGRVIIASKGRFDRARSAKQRAAEGLPSEATVITDDFLSLTLDVWSIPPESARRVGHPAPFPVELPEHAPYLRLLTRGAEEASEAEQIANPRSASVRLRAAERIRATTDGPTPNNHRTTNGEPR